MALPGPETANPGDTDLGAELVACLEVLAEFLDGDTWPTETGVEFVSACAQLCELVPLLAAENQQAWEVIDGLKEMAVQQATEKQLGMNRAQRRALKRTNGGIILPR